MPARIASLTVITVLFTVAVIFSYSYGPSRRSFAARPTVLSVETTEQILQVWESHGVKGRIAICFTRYLNVLETKESKEAKATERAMNLGIVRKVYHVPPDSAWPEIHASLSRRTDMRPTPEGFIGIFDDGRVYIAPLSRFAPFREKALFLVEPKIWSPDELMRIVDLLKSGSMSADLVVIVRGAEREAEPFRRALGLQRP